MMQLPVFFKRGRARWVVLTLVILGIIAGIWWWRNSQSQADSTVVRPEYRSLSQVIEFSGVTDASERSALRFAAGGKLTFVGAKESDLVKKWQTLATIDARSAKKNLEMQLNEFDVQRLEFANQMDTRKDTLREDPELRRIEQDQIALNQKVLGVEIQSLAIEETRLISPIEGILVSAPQAVSGTNVLPTDVYEIFNPKTMFFEAYVDEVDVANVYVGQVARLRLDAFRDEEFTGKVTKIAFRSAASTSGGTVFPIEIQFDESIDLARLRLGLNGEASLVLAERERALSLPIEAVTSRGGKDFVMVRQADGEPQEREIQTGLVTEDYIEIISGVSESDEVILP